MQLAVNIQLLGLNSKNLPAKRKKTIVCRMSSDTAHWRNVYTLESAASAALRLVTRKRFKFR